MVTRLVVPPEGVGETVGHLSSGELVALPTETVYGLGGNALDPLVCAKIFEAKDRPLSDPLIVHLPDSGWLDRLACPNPLATRLAEAFWPGPLTMVLPRRADVPDLVTAGQDTVAVRWSAHPVFQQVITGFGRPIAAPSANRFGRISPTTAEHVRAELDGRIPLILDGGSCRHGLESTIVLVRGEELSILRHGPVTEEQLAAFGNVKPSAGGVAAPGTMASHYAPRTGLLVLAPEQTYVPTSGTRTGLLAWKGLGAETEAKYASVERLSASGDLREAAANLYAALRRLDEAGLDQIVAQSVPGQGLGAAIMDRLRRASYRDGNPNGEGEPPGEP